MNFLTPSEKELAYLRPDPLLWEQELDVRPEFAESLEKAVGLRAGKAFWRSAHDHLYALELADLGEGRPSMATVYGYWERYEPRPPEREIDLDLLEFITWSAEVSEDIEATDVQRVASFHQIPGPIPESDLLRTPEDRFAHLPGFPYEAKYVEIEGMRMAYVEAGEGDPILMLHGEPTWSFLYRKMIPPMSTAGRCIAPDLIGFGRSDKPTSEHAYSYRAHVRWMRKFIAALDLKNITLICQDWGGSIGLRVLSQMPERFARVVATHTSISDGSAKPEAFLRWRRASQRMREMDIALLMRATLNRTQLTDEEAAAYAAPFPSAAYQAGALIFPRLVPAHDCLGAHDNRIAIEILKSLDIPALLPWGDSDPITAPSRDFLEKIFKNATLPERIQGAGHFIQDDAGEELAAQILAWMDEG